MKSKVIKGISFLLALDLVFLLAFAKSYSTLTLFPPFFYAHDVMLLIMVLLCIPYFKFSPRIRSIELLFLMAIFYLIYSFFNPGIENVEIILRQFMIFGYGICLYVIMKSVFINKTIRKNFAQSVMYFGLACVTVQILYIPFVFLYEGKNPFFERWYFSPIIMMGIFILASYILLNVKDKLLKNILFASVFIVSFSTGHDSTYLSLSMIYIAYLFVVSSRNHRIILTMSLFIAIVLVFYFIPSFTDVNVKWRLLFWKDSLLRIANNYFIFGDGFGIPYGTEETIKNLNSLYPDVPKSPRIIGDEIYLTAPHNSFLSMAIHIGILSIVFLFYPIKEFFTNKSLRMDKEILFLTLSLFGMVVFCAFNVILELPHSSSIFWIVLFGLIFKLSEKIGIPSDE
ncbi:O-antigen ligase family protein [Gelidibacter sp.]|uniref:O-antigen ligase family protein n=1 Tax=Gelidibacter sp. TaxID=2018083 RepID=UPI002C5D56A4|nr:O-antigen ligase family protein [Gelidibacter sp.]HUH28967.1 O-antigen ligase family protein [Gelidibacter sp.]